LRSPLVTLLKRRDFLAAAKARRWAAAGLVLQGRRRRPDEPDPGAVRVGYTCSKKVGGAVVRNRAKRRLREAARLTLPGVTLARLDSEGWDLVLIGRDATGRRPFAQLMDDLRGALKQAGVAR
jgi:ribonuclease P protein component